MAMTINTNMFSLNAQRNLRKAESPLQSAMQRLSSGLRINSAKDDAAGLAIGTRMNRQIIGLSVSIRNANDGVSFAQTAEGAMDEMTTSMQRIYELAEQAASNNTSTDRSNMNVEVQELIAELNRVVNQTRFNGEKFLNQAKSIDVQVGADVRETINISTSNVSPNTFGVATNYSDTWTGTDIAKSAGLAMLSTGVAANATINGKDIGDAITSATAFKNNSQNLVNRINDYTSEHGVTAFSYGNSVVANTAIAAITLTSATAAQYVDSGYLTINGTQVGSFVAAAAGAAASADTAMSNMISAINAKSATTGVVAYSMDKSDFTVSSVGQASSLLVLTNTSGAAISVSLNSSVTNGTAFTTLLASSTMSVAAGQNGKIVFNGNFGAGSTTFDGTATGAALGISSSASTIALTDRSVNEISVTNNANANIAILVTGKALDTLNSQRATLGAKLNRLESTIRNLDNVRENLDAAKSRIMDADYAEESAKMTKAMIMQQAGVSVLTQANTIPQQVLALLRG